MILRSGLIRRSESVSSEDFESHWEHVHGPLTLPVPGLRAYSQNHIVQRSDDADTQLIHRVDGMSQLWFDSLDAMRVAMQSPEQAACNRDLRAFLSRATILIQQLGDIQQGGWTEGARVKQMFLVSAATRLDLGVLARRLRGICASFRINAVLEQVSSAIEAEVGEPLIAVVEVWASRSVEVQALVNELSSSGPVPGYTVHEIALLTLSSPAREQARSGT